MNIFINTNSVVINYHLYVYKFLKTIGQAFDILNLFIGLPSLLNYLALVIK